MKESLPRPHRLTARQERFCELIAAAESQTNAWLLAGYKVSREVARRNAAEALNLKPRMNANKILKINTFHDDPFSPWSAISSCALRENRRHALKCQMRQPKICNC
jgi:hypothetical protein